MMTMVEESAIEMGSTGSVGGTLSPSSTVLVGDDLPVTEETDQERCVPIIFNCPGQCCVTQQS